MTHVGEYAADRPTILEPDSLRHDASTGDVVLIGSRCTRCGRRFFPPRRRCAACAEETLVAHDLSSRGQLRSFTRLHRTPPDAWVSAPYVLAEVVLPDGLVIYAHLIDTAWEDLRVEMSIELAPFVIRPPDGGEVLAYAFRAVSDEAVGA